MTYQRVQILLTPDQYRRLKRLARRRSQSLSAVVREFIQQGLEAATMVGASPQEADLSWLWRTDETARRIQARRGGKPLAVDAVALIRSIREERADELASGASRS